MSIHLSKEQTVACRIALRHYRARPLLAWLPFFSVSVTYGDNTLMLTAVS